MTNMVNITVSTQTGCFRVGNVSPWSHPLGVLWCFVSANYPKARGIFLTLLDDLYNGIT